MDWGSFPKMIASRTKRDIITYDARGLGNSEYQPPRVSPSSFSATAAAGGIGLLEEEEGESHVLSLDLMALDALTVVNSYYEYLEQEGYSESMIVGQEEGGKGGFGQEHEATKCFCVGGVSMGGMVAQALSQLIHDRAYLLERPMRDQLLRCNIEKYRISSLGLISSSPIRQRRNRTYLLTPDIPPGHFLASFDDFHHEERRQESTRRFFQALGDDFLSKTGRKTLQEKLILKFISSRERFENGIGMKSILAQRKVILNEIDGIWRDGRGRPNLNFRDTEEESKDHHPLCLRSLNIPTIVVHGTKDKVIPFGHAEMLHSLATKGASRNAEMNQNSESQNNNAALIPIEQCGHFPWITNAHDLVNILANFWSGENI